MSVKITITEPDELAGQYIADRLDDGRLALAPAEAWRRFDSDEQFQAWLDGDDQAGLPIAAPKLEQPLQ